MHECTHRHLVLFTLPAGRGVREMKRTSTMLVKGREASSVTGASDQVLGKMSTRSRTMHKGTGVVGGYDMWVGAGCLSCNHWTQCCT